MVTLFDWEKLRGEHSITTTAQDTGEYPLPDDFSHMIDQTNWERNESVPVYGPLSAQQWAYLEGRNLVTSTIYVSFRLFDGKYNVFPQPPPTDLEIFFEYQSRNWLTSASAPEDTFEQIQTGSDIVSYEPFLIIKYLKLKFLTAKGFDTAAAAQDFQGAFNSWTGKDKGNQVLNAGRQASWYRYLDIYYNTPDTGYGLT